MFLFVALMQWLTGLALDAAWTGLETAGTRVYSATAYRAAFGLCLAVAGGAVALAACITETRCRNVWRSEESSWGPHPRPTAANRNNYLTRASRPTLAICSS